MRFGRAAVVVAFVLTAWVPLARANPPTSGGTVAPTDLPDLAQPEINDPISDAELEDLKTLASQKRISLQAASDRYAWNDNFALAVATVRASNPEAFTGAEIVDGRTAWVAFAASAPDRAMDSLQAFEEAHATVAVEVRADFGFTEAELETAIATIHYSVFEAANVRDATTSFDFNTRQITSVVALEGGVADSELAELRTDATESLIASGLRGILDSVAVSVVQSSLPALGGRVDNTAHIGGESLGTCTSGFVVKDAAGVRGISTAGHCNNALNDDTVGLVFQAEHGGGQGDFQWHTGHQGEPDDFLCGQRCRA